WPREKASGPIFVASYHSSSNKLDFGSLKNMEQFSGKTGTTIGYFATTSRRSKSRVTSSRIRFERDWCRHMKSTHSPDPRSTRFENWPRLWRFGHDGLRRAKACATLGILPSQGKALRHFAAIAAHVVCGAAL